MADQPHIIDDGFSEPEQVRKIFVGNLPYEADEGMWFKITQSEHSIAKFFTRAHVSTVACTKEFSISSVLPWKTRKQFLVFQDTTRLIGFGVQIGVHYWVHYSVHISALKRSKKGKSKIIKSRYDKNAFFSIWGNNWLRCTTWPTNAVCKGLCFRYLYQGQGCWWRHGK